MQWLPSATKLRRLCFYRHLSVHRGVGVSASVHAGIPHPPQEADPPEADTPPQEQTPPTADTPQEQTPPKSRHPPEADTPQEQTPPRSRHPLKSRHPPPRYGHCCGRYASYWNAFLFLIFIRVKRFTCTVWQFFEFFIETFILYSSTDYYC